MGIWNDFYSHPLGFSPYSVNSGTPCYNLYTKVGCILKYSRDLLLQVREFMERHCDALEIAHRIGIDPQDVIVMIEIIKGIIQ